MLIAKFNPFQALSGQFRQLDSGLSAEPSNQGTDCRSALTDDGRQVA
jgi:hypothetical protein